MLFFGHRRSRSDHWFIRICLHHRHLFYVRSDFASFQLINYWNSLNRVIALFLIEFFCLFLVISINLDDYHWKDIDDELSNSRYYHLYSFCDHSPPWWLTAIEIIYSEAKAQQSKNHDLPSLVRKSEKVHRAQFENWMLSFKNFLALLLLKFSWEFNFCSFSLPEDS